jgi:hypothetical protein
MERPADSKEQIERVETDMRSTPTRGGNGFIFANGTWGGRAPGHDAGRVSYRSKDGGTISRCTEGRGGGQA